MLMVWRDRVSPARLRRPVAGIAQALTRTTAGTVDQARWAAGALLAMRSHLAGNVPVNHVTERAPSRRRHPARDRQLPGAPEDLQRVSDGVGPLFLRRYQARIAEARLGPAQLLRTLRADINVATSGEIARFEKIRGRRGSMRLGDEYAAHLLGPWACRVRVVECAPNAIRLATLRGHMEAGEIRFSCTRHRDGTLVFTIESWARSGDRLFDLLYDRLPVAREAQLYMWSRFCARAAVISGGRLVGPVTVLTRRHSEAPRMRAEPSTAPAAGGRSGIVSTSRAHRGWP
jgi:hypothetical protein